MAFKGTARKSASGASMSKYDVEVAAALKKINARLDALEARHMTSVNLLGVEMLVQ